MIQKALPMALAILAFSLAGLAQPASDEKALAVIAKAVAQLGGDSYLHVTSQIGRGSFSQLRQGGVASFQPFTDAIVFPNKERTDFKGSSRSVQVNVGDTGWVYDGDQELIKNQTPTQIDNFRRGNRVSIDTLLRGYWQGKGTVAYVGRRPGTLGKRNDVIKLTYNDGFAVEFEFTDDGTPVKALYKRSTGIPAAASAGGTSSDAIDLERKEEDRYAQFVAIDGVKVPFIVDHFTDGEPVSRINYESIDINKRIPESAFAKPANPKEAKKDPKY